MNPIVTPLTRLAAGRDGYIIENIGYSASPACGRALLHLACGGRTANAQDIELRYCPRCRSFLEFGKENRGEGDDHE